MIIILIEDNETLAKIYSRALSLNGYETIYFLGGQQAIHWIVLNDATQIRLVICDLALPDMSGVDVAVQLRDHCGYRGPILAMSGAAQLIDPAKLEPAHFVDLLMKPMRLNDLIAAVKQQIGEA